MSSNDPRTLARTFGVALTLLMVMPVFATSGTSLLHFTSSTQDQRIVNQWGAGAPFGTWAKTDEPVTFYFHGDPGCADGVQHVPNPLQGRNTTFAVGTVSTCASSQQASGLPGGAPTAAPFQPHWWLDTRTPSAPVPAEAAPTDPSPKDNVDKSPQRVVLYSVDSTGGGGAIAPVGQTLDFDNNNCLHNRMQVMDETTVTGFDSAIDMAGNRLLQDRVRVWVSLLNADCTPKNPANPYIAIYDMATSTPSDDGWAHFTGSWTFPFIDPTQPYGVVMAKGDRLRVSLGLISDGNLGDSSAIVAFDGSQFNSEEAEGGSQGSQSFLTVHSDSIRVNQWTSDRFGQVTQNFPHTSTDHPADVADRTVHWAATVFDTWGHQDDEWVGGATGQLIPNGPTYTAGQTPITSTDPYPYNDCNLMHRRTTVIDIREWPSSNCRHDAFDEQKMRVRVKDVTPGHAGFDRYVPADLRLGISVWDSSSTYDTSFFGCCDAQFLRPIHNKAAIANPSVGSFAEYPQYKGRTTVLDTDAGLSNFDYDIVYSTDFLDGVYQVEFQESSKLWRFATQFIVGNTGFDFHFANDEGPISADNTTAFHTVSLGETTQYVFTVKNSGSVADTIGLAIPVPGNGWTATVTPNTASLAPGASLEVVATVVPPSTVHAGDKKVVAVAATSTITNTVKTLYTITTYTTDTTKTAPFLTSPQKEINIRPKLDAVFPLVLHNPGVVQDDYVVTGTLDEGSGACPTRGFVVQVNPTFLPVYAASRQALSVKVVVPGEAAPGCTYTIHFQACSTLGQDEEGGILCSPILEMPVRIFLIDALRVSALTNLINLRDAEMDQYKVECKNKGGDQGAGAGPGVTVPVTVTDTASSTVVATDVQGSEQCTYLATSQDVHFDNGGIFRILVENNGDRTDRVELTGGWAKASEQNGAWFDRGECEGTPNNTGDGVPDGWRYRMLPGSPQALAAGFATPGGWPVDPGPTYPQPAGAGPAVAPRFTPNPSGPPFPAWAPNEGMYDGSSQHSGVMDVTGPQFGAGHDSTFAGESRFGWLTLPAHTSQWVYVETYWVPPIWSFIDASGRKGTSVDSDGSNNPGCALEPTVTVPGWGLGTGLCQDPVFGATVAPCQGAEAADIYPEDQHPLSFRHTMPSPWATLRLSYRSTNDDSIRGSMKLTSHLTGGDQVIDNDNNSKTRMLHNVRIELAVGQPQDGFANINNTQEPWATYNIAATNTGNEYDDLVLSVGDGHNGWRHTIRPINAALVDNQIQSTGIVPSGQGASQCITAEMAPCGGATFANPTPYPGVGEGIPRTPRDCAPPDLTSQRMVCHSIGVYDTVYFQVRATPPAGAAVGSYDDMDIHVSSSRSKDQVPSPGTVADFITVRSFVQGVFGFSLLHNNDNLVGWRGQTIAFPFTIKNVGTTNDVYRLFVDPADFEYYHDWNPTLSATSGFVNLDTNTPTPALVGVPAGHEFHGFVSVTVPADEEKWPLTDPDFVDPDPQIRALRLDVLSTQGFGQTGVIDFFPVLTPTPEMTMKVQENQVAGGTDLENNAGRMRITAEGDFNYVLMDGYYQSPPNAVGAGGQPSLPSGFRFVCLPPTHAEYDNERKCYDPYAPFNDPACTGCTLNFQVEPRFNSAGIAIQQLEMHVPTEQLGTSRMAHRIQGVVDGCTMAPHNPNDCVVSYADAIVDMASTYGVKLTAACDSRDHPEIEMRFDTTAQCVIPPGTPGSTSTSGPTVKFLVDVGNTGLAPQSVLLSNSKLPDGWQIFYNGTTVHVQPPGYALADSSTECALLGKELCLPLNPLSHFWQEVGLVAPVTAKEGDTATIILFGTVQEDPTLITQVVLHAVVGHYGLTLEVAPQTEWVAPQETARFPIVIRNEGNLPDVFQVQALVPSAAGSSFPTSWADGIGCDNNDPQLPPVPVPDVNAPPICYVMLPAWSGEGDPPARTLRLDVQTPDQVAPTGQGPGYTVTIAAHSLYRPSAAESIQAKVKILNYVTADVDGDLLPEYAIDGCTTESQLDGCNPDPSDGYETFRENLQQAGTITQDLRGVPELEQFLSPQGRAAWTASDGTVTYYVDLDRDGRTDHLLDTDGDGLPNVGWMPSVPRVQALVGPGSLTKDVTLDQLPDYFIDLEGDKQWDYVYDLSLGRSFTLIQKQIDNDGFTDYVVDLNDNGIDLSDTILFGGPNGAITKVLLMADVDGNGILDQVIDADGDGRPDFFLPAKQDGTYGDSISITLQDVTGDGKLDWTYDHTGANGRPDQYYDPVTQKAGVIDSKGAFLHDLQTYWWVLMLFLVAVAFFVVLVFVTRKR